MEKFYLSKALLKMAGGGMHPPHPPPPSGTAPGRYSKMVSIYVDL